ncbi:MAG TPA: hypothetical protein PKZ26_08900 [Anaerolineaceae bacterium]|jgi:hypothetical protein|nr:hypothetical protein [Chloroflexota bacterium]HNS07173.1 hypothetical protein [Anaerolineaceae bacterium]HOE02258.1 hypothetical protein [Anaerolineaceae bacterium]HPD62605.1 hypothetical protein [Anaerolineaceae bacterium]HRT91345.1 hypothetical protein [Anaerolineaceae bacterium]
MSTYTLGQNCHVILSHAEIDSGAPYGFVSPKDGTVRECGAQFIRQVESESTTYTDIVTGTRLWINFDIICADDLLEPNGAEHTPTRLQDYAKLLDFLSKPSGIQCTTPVGTFTNLGALGFSADERHLPKHSIIRVQLNNVGFYFPPADPEKIAASVWDGPLTWETSYWV